MKYEHLDAVSREQAEEGLRSLEIDEVRRTAAVLSSCVDDRRWAEQTLGRLLEHPDSWVVGSSVVGLVELVRQGHELDISTLVAKLQETAIRRPEVAGRVESALEDLSLVSSD